VSDSDHPKGHADLKALAEKLERPLHTLYAMDAQNDPLMCQQDYRSDAAHWISDLYERLKVRAGIHIRRLFYLMVSQPDLIRLNGKRFENTTNCSQHLGNAVRDARYLGLIPVNAFIDLKNPEPTINLSDDYDDGDTVAEIEIYHGLLTRSAFGRDYRAPDVSLPRAKLVQEPSFGQRYHLEIWIEKATANDVLLPLGREYGINIATFTGEVSVTACKNLVDRAIASGKPVRILHVTDFDPAGHMSMPVAAAVKIDFFAKQSGVDLDIQFEHVGLTEEQCVKYNLPRTPIKERELRAANFEAQHGKGGTELDALEALHPGVLRQILLDHIERYRDDDIDEEVENAIKEYQGELNGAQMLVRSRHAEELTEIDRQRDAIRERFGQVQLAAEAARTAIVDPAQGAYDAIVQPARAAYEAIVAAARRDLDAIVDEAEHGLATMVRQAGEMRDEIIEAARDEIEAMEQPLVAEAQMLITQINAEFDEAVTDPDQFDWPEPRADEWDNPLYDSTRDYVAQVDRFREHQGKDADVRLAKNRPITKICTVCGQPFSTATRQKTACSPSMPQ
jgi:hypothetical protein